MFEKLERYWKFLGTLLGPAYVTFRELSQDGAMTREDWSELLVSVIVCIWVYSKANTVRGENVQVLADRAVGTTTPRTDPDF